MQTQTDNGTMWTLVSTHIRELVTDQQYNTWFRSVRPVQFDREGVTLAAPNEFIKDWLTRYYLDTLSRAVARALGARPKLEIVIDPDIDQIPVETESTSSSNSPPVCTPTYQPSIEKKTADTPRTLQTPRHPDDGFNVVNNSYQFENFIVGPNNRLCHAAALAVSENLGGIYNPYFLHGSVGLGKTHLLQAICHRVLEQRPNARVAYTSCETFINQFISSVERGNVESFRNRYRQTDILLIDDIHLLAHKERTQEEFFHTFNALYQAGKQIVLTSDSPPRDIPTLEERLVSRFKSGLVTLIEPPVFETRVAIVQTKARLRSIELPLDVCHYIAELVTSNIRELEGAIIKVGGYAALSRVPVDLALAREALRDVIRSSGPSITIQDIMRVVTTHYSVRPQDIISKKRSQSITHPRQIIMYLARKYTPLSLEEIGMHLGGRDHTTVMYGIDRIRDQLDSNLTLRQTIPKLLDELRLPH